MAELTARTDPLATLRSMIRTVLRPGGGPGRTGSGHPPSGRRSMTPEPAPRATAPAAMARPAFLGPAPSAEHVHGGPPPPSPGLALALAVRQELTRPGSVPARRQFELIMAEHDYYCEEGRSGPAGKPRRGWTPFLASVDPCPYRALAAGSWELATPIDPDHGPAMTDACRHRP